MKGTGINCLSWVLIGVRAIVHFESGQLNSYHTVSCKSEDGTFKAYESRTPDIIIVVY